ncbi:mitochondrial carrier superfamily protein [Toxoplasma gondii FOU]|uniref:Mitochondrial carrier superfamily protein n=1 Tax=Toxoplasma gondii FOU TaxID=943167 RepID=A0A086KYJ3_TOXGO|nr:mitochondrial carrier superfamily protein [Toxoplasma gondii FOU]
MKCDEVQVARGRSVGHHPPLCVSCASRTHSGDLVLPRTPRARAPATACRKSLSPVAPMSQNLSLFKFSACLSDRRRPLFWIVFLLFVFSTVYSFVCISTHDVATGRFAPPLLPALALQTGAQPLVRTAPLPAKPNALASAIPLSSSHLSSSLRRKTRGTSGEADHDDGQTPDTRGMTSPLASATRGWWPQRLLLSLKLGLREDVECSPDEDGTLASNSFDSSDGEPATETAREHAVEAVQATENSVVKRIQEAGNSLCCLRRRAWTAACRAADALVPRSGFAKRLTSTVVTRLAIQSLLYPIDVVRCRRAQGVPFKDIPVGALYNGCLSILAVSELPYCMLCVTLQTHAQKLLSHHAGKLPTVAKLFLSAVAADSVGSMYKTPFDCAKGLLQRGKAASPQEALTTVLRDDPSILKAQYRGFYAQVLRDATYRVLNGQTMQMLRRVIAARQQAEQSSEGRTLQSGIVARAREKLRLSAGKDSPESSLKPSEGKLNWARDLLAHGMQGPVDAMRGLATRLTNLRHAGMRRQGDAQLKEQADITAEQTGTYRSAPATSADTVSPPSAAPVTLGVGLLSGALTTFATSPLEAARRYIVEKSQVDSEPGSATRLQGLLGVCRALYEIAEQRGVLSGWFRNAPTRMLVAGPCNALSALLFERTSRSLTRLFPETDN